MRKNNGTWIKLLILFFPVVAFRLYDLDKDDKISRDELLQVNSTGAALNDSIVTLSVTSHPFRMKTGVKTVFSKELLEEFGG